MKEKGRIIIALRKKGRTYGEIEKILKLPKSTVAWWLKNIQISKSLREKILKRSKEKWRENITNYNKRYAKIRSNQARLKRERVKERAIKEIKALTKRDIRLIGSALYWAEGNTKNRNRLQFTNSNPAMIKIMMHFFRKTCNVSNDKIRARIHIYPGLNYRKVLNFWSKIMKLSRNNFYAPQIKISGASKGKRAINTLPYGTVNIVIMNTEIASKVLGWIKGISK